MAQAIHAAIGFALHHHDVAQVWHRDSQFLVAVSVPDEAGVLALAQSALALGVEPFVWHEPDQSGEATAVALTPTAAAARLCSSLPLAGRSMV
jgi:peptidyl-tRNA hydrolase